MPIKTPLDVSPYFDDFDANNQYYRVLFKPSVAVQARELNQVQSILQNQIETFGNWAFQNGDIVKKAGSTITPLVDDPEINFVRLADYQTDGDTFDAQTFANLQFVSATSNLTATVITSNTGLSVNYPNTNVIYVKYQNTGTGGEKIFSNNETLWAFTSPTPTPLLVNADYVIKTYANSITGQITTGLAHGCHVEGDMNVFINGSFVKVLTPAYGVVNSFGTYASNNVVGFQLKETIVTDYQDQSLLDNALGYPNENAPGASRLKLEPYLISLDQDTAKDTEGFIPVGVYNYGKLVNTKTGLDTYGVVDEKMAKRTYEESGNYVVKPFNVDSVTLNNNDGVTPLSPDRVYGRISPGSGYAQGYPVNLTKTAYIDMRRGTDVQTNLAQQITFGYGSYFICNEVAGLFPFDKAQSVDLYDTAQNAVTTHNFSSISPAGDKIGTAKLKCFTFNDGIPGTSAARYIIHVFDIVMFANKNANQIKSLYYNGTIKGVADVSVPGVQKTGTKDQLYSFGASAMKNLKNAENAVNTQYIYRTIDSSHSMTTGGDVTITITDGNSELPYGAIGALPDSDAATFNLIVKNTTDSAALGGKINISSTVTTVFRGSGGTGSTAFTSDFNVGDQITVGSDTRTITAIESNSLLTVDAVWPSTLTNQTYFKTYKAGKIIPLTQVSGKLNSSVEITNTTEFTIHTSEKPGSAMAVSVIFDVRKRPAVPAKKDIKKSRYVKLDTTKSPYGPWCLGFSDVHKIRNVFGGSDYSVSNPNLTTNFTFDTGQTDTHYGLSYLHPNPGYSTAYNPKLLVELDYFVANSSSGVGFFTVDSYAIDDVNSANSTAIQTKDIPLYVDESGKKIPLRDYVDFRIPCLSTAADSTTVGGATIIDPSQSSYITTYANSVFAIPVGGLNVPSYGRNLQSDYTFYLPRKDLVLLTPDNKIKAKEGLSSTSPQTPLLPDNAMALAVVNVAPYPSLSTDQIDEFLAINKSSKNLIRDVTTGITTNNITNRRYTMRDIGTLDTRITNLEYYQALSLLEKKTTDMTVTDVNGLNRFKNGIFVDPLNDFTQSEVSNPEYSIAIDSGKGLARPRIIREVITIDYKTGTNVQKTGRSVTLTYTETPFLVQPFSTKYRSSAHVSLAWNGTCILIPSYDNHSDINNTGSINIKIDTTTPWKEFAKSPFGSIMGDWRTSQSVTQSTVTTNDGGFIPEVNLGSLGLQFSQWEAEQEAIARIHSMYGSNVTVGRYSISYG